MYWDLHFHTTDSDGTKTNEERIEQILALDPQKEWVWATTNHDRFSPGFVEVARDAGIKSIWATEISAHSDELDLSLHITCYVPQVSARIAAIIEGIITKRKNKIIGQIAKLRERGFPITESDFFDWIMSTKMSPENATNWHLAQYLWRQKNTIEVVSHLTGGSVTSELDFMRECLRENGDWNQIGYFRIPRYEPELNDLVAIAKQEDMVLSVAHPNFSFTKNLVKTHGATNTAKQIEIFHGRIVPILSDIGIRNYEVNAIASPEWKHAIVETTQKTGGYTTFGSDNHGLDHADSKHGVFGKMNPSLTDREVQPIFKKLRSFV